MPNHVKLRTPQESRLQHYYVLICMKYHTYTIIFQCVLSVSLVQIDLTCRSCVDKSMHIGQHPIKIWCMHPLVHENIMNEVITLRYMTRGKIYIVGPLNRKEKIEEGSSSGGVLNCTNVYMETLDRVRAIKDRKCK